MDPLLIVSGMLSAAVIALLVLWRRADAKARRTVFDRTAAERLRIGLELALAEQRGRLSVVGELQDGAVLSVARLISQAEGAKYTAAKDPSTAVRAAAALVVDGRVALADMRRVLTILRVDDTAARPEPDLQSAEGLVRVMRDAGLKVRHEESGERFPLKPGAELALYRILQSALSNSLTHGGVGTDVRIALTWTRDGLQLLVDDDGIRAAARRQSAHDDDIAARTAYTIDDDLKALSGTFAGGGITQMRERTQAFGGVFSAATVPGVGFSVSAIFPSLRFHNGVHGVNLGR
ncbi:MAG: ATP-binding protein [Cryobacterium sp.]